MLEEARYIVLYMPMFGKDMGYLLVWRYWVHDGEYYFSHNVFLDFAVVFGIWFDGIFAWYSYRVYKFVIRTGSKTAEFAVFFC